MFYLRYLYQIRFPYQMMFVPSNSNRRVSNVETVLLTLAGHPNSPSVFLWGLCCSIFKFLCSVLMIIYLYFCLFLWSLYCLSFFYSWLLVTSLQYLLVTPFSIFWVLPLVFSGYPHLVSSGYLPFSIFWLSPLSIFWLPPFSIFWLHPLQYLLVTPFSILWLPLFSIFKHSLQTSTNSCSEDTLLKYVVNYDKHQQQRFIFLCRLHRRLFEIFDVVPVLNKCLECNSV